MKLFATSVVIQLRSGGNLADMMERLADVIRDRIRLSAARPRADRPDAVQQAHPAGPAAA